jgi:excisionase family DNA binding protein
VIEFDRHARQYKRTRSYRPCALARMMGHNLEGSTLTRKLTIKEVSRRLALAPATLRAQIKRGSLKASKPGRDWFIDESEVERYQRENRRPRAGN